MSLTEVDPSTTLTSLSTSLDSLENTLKPLLSSSSSLSELFAQAEGDIAPLERARARIMLAYSIHNLIWVYLQTSAVDPAAHPVMAELTRLETYFSKLIRADPSLAPRSSLITSTSEPGPSTPSITGTAPGGRTTSLDLDAATRFITAAIGGKRQPKPTEEGKHTRFDDPEEEDSSSSSSSSNSDQDKDVVEKKKKVQVQEKGKGKGKAMGRPRMDPFAGYDDLTVTTSKKSNQTGKSSKPTDVPSAVTSNSSSKKRSSPLASEAGQSSASTAVGLSKHQKKKMRLKVGGELPGEATKSSTSTLGPSGQAGANNKKKAKKS